MPRRLIPLRVLLLAIFLLQAIGVVSFTVWLSLASEKRSVAEINQRLETETFDRIQGRINRYLETASFINDQNSQDLASQDLSIEQPARLIRRFWQQRSLFKITPVTAIYFGSADGRFSGLGLQDAQTWQMSRVDEGTDRRFFTYAVDSQGNRTRLLNQGQRYDPRLRPWYQQAIQTQRLTWSTVYEDFKERRLTLTLSQPVYTARRQLMGVVGVDFTLTQISSYLKSLLARDLLALMIVDPTGKIVSTSTGEVPYRLTSSGTLERLKIEALKNPELSAIAPSLNQMLQQNQGHLIKQTVRVQGQLQHLWVAPLQDEQNLNLWIVAVANQPNFFKAMAAHTRQALLLCLVVLMLAILLSLVTSRKLSQGLQTMVQGGRAIAAGNLDHQFPNSVILELSQLSETFNAMARHLSQSFSELESRVQARTAALKQSEEKFSKVFYCSPNPAAISRVRDGCFIEVNESTLKLLGFERAEFLNRTGFELDIGVNPQDHETLVRRIRAKGPVRAREWQLKHQSGEIKTVLYSADLIELNDEPHLVSLMIEITERKKTEEALRLSEEKFAKIFHASPNPMSISRMVDGYFLEVNFSAAQFMGGRLDQIVGKTSSQLNLWVETAERERVIASLKNHQAVRSHECRLRTQLGEIKTVLFSAELIELENQLCLICTINDITERRQSEEALRQAKLDAERANRAKSTFLANMSHELRTPLNAILGFAQILHRDSTLGSKQREYIGVINRSGEHLLEMINNVLNIAKIEAGRVELNLSNFDLDLCLKDLQQMFGMKAAVKGLSLSVHKVDGVPQFIRTDEGKLRQILINLLGNAIKFTDLGYVQMTVRLQDSRHQFGSKEPEPPFTVKALQHNTGFLDFEVKDTGSGIAPHEQNSIFEAFTQGQQGRGHLVGTGLGLTISRNFAQMMGGNIFVQSRLGQGTTFRLCIPVELGLASKPQEPLRKVVGLTPGQSYRLLIVDDQWESRQLMTSLLEPLGFEVRDTENGQEAVAVWEDWRPHLIWMDMRMPVMDGYEATQRIKSHPQGNTTCIIALTASVLDEEKRVILSAGCDGFVQKPFREATIFEILERHLGVQFEFGEAAQPISVEEFPTAQDWNELAPEHFRDLPKEWIIQVHRASQSVDNAKLRQLIAWLPETHRTLADLLEHLVRNFRCDTIYQVTEQLL